MTYLFCAIIAKSQSYNPQTGRVSNFNAKYQFGTVGAWDDDMEQMRTDYPPYRALTTIVIRIDNNSKGNIFVSQYRHEKLTYDIIDCYKGTDQFTFTWILETGESRSIILHTKKKKVRSIQFKSPDRTSLVYY